MLNKHSLVAFILGLIVGGAGVFYFKYPMLSWMMSSHYINEANQDILLTHYADLWHQGETEKANKLLIYSLVPRYLDYDSRSSRLTGHEQKVTQDAAKAIKSYVEKWPTEECRSLTLPFIFDCEVEGYKQKDYQLD